MRKALLLATTLPLLTVAAPADAVRVRGCVSTAEVSFNPPLTTRLQSGTIGWSYTASCAVAYGSGATGVEVYSASLTFGYSGSCVTAVITGGGDHVGVLAGGTVAVVAAGPSFVRASAWTLVPDSRNPCAMSSAIGVQAGPDVLL
jgi:hypothetical protein